MTKEIREYRKELDGLLEKNSPDTDWERLCREIKVRISFYRHERLVHLIVTVSVSLMTVILFCTASLTETVSVQLMLLAGLLLILTAAYLVYYFKLENAVQKIYSCYYKAAEKARK